MEDAVSNDAPPPPPPPQRPSSLPPRHPSPSVAACLRASFGPSSAAYEAPAVPFQSRPASAPSFPSPWPPHFASSTPYVSVSDLGRPLPPVGFGYSRLTTPLSMMTQLPLPPPPSQSASATSRETTPSQSASSHLAFHARLWKESSASDSETTGTPLVPTPASMLHQQPPPPPPPSSHSSAIPRGGTPRGTTRPRSASPQIMRSAAINLGECVVCPNVLPAEKAPKLPKAARAVLPDDLPGLFVCSPACASHLQGNSHD